MGLIEDLSTEFKRRCEAIATEQRSLLDLRAFDRLPACELATHLGATILTPDQLFSLERQHLWNQAIRKIIEQEVTKTLWLQPSPYKFQT